MPTRRLWWLLSVKVGRKEYYDYKGSTEDHHGAVLATVGS